ALIAIAGLHVVTGLAGQLSLGHAGFVAVGAFAAAAAHLHLGLPFLAGVVLGAAAGGLLGLAAGLPALRLRGLYLGITTLAVQVIILAAGQRYQIYLQTSRG